MEPIRKDHPLRRLFSGLIDHTFCTEVGMCDPCLTTYLADLLVSFTHIDRLNAIRNARGKRLDQVAAMLAIVSDDQPATEAERDRSMYRHIGDYSLFWAGLYPEHLERNRHDGCDSLQVYVSQGKQSYAMASKVVTEEDRPPSSLFRHLSEEFEFCVHGLGLVRRGWETTNAAKRDSSGELLY